MQFDESPVGIWVCTETYDVMRDVLQPKLKKYLDPDRIIDESFVKKDCWSYIKYKAADGTISEVTFKSYDQGRKRFQGAGKQFIWFDEEPPRDIWEECTVREEAGRVLRIALTMTPVQGMCFDEKTKILSPRGWLGIDDMKIGESIYTLNKETIKIEEKPVDYIHKSKSNSLVSMNCRGFDALITKDHRWFVRSKATGKFEIRETQQLKTHHVIPCAIPSGFSGSGWMHDWYVELIGWFVTEGHYDKKRRRISICQSLSRYPENCALIENAFRKSSCEFAFSDSVYHRGEKCEGSVRQFCTVDSALVRKMMQDCPNKLLTVKFVSQLGREQQELLYETLIRGDGSRNSNGDRYTAPISQKETVDSLIALCHALGRKATYRLEGKKVIRVHIQRSKRYTPNTHVSNIHFKEVSYRGRIWCPHTENETVIAMRGGTSYVSMNTWVYEELYLATSNPDVRVLTASWDDNPWLPQDQKDRMARGLTPEALQVRREGKFVRMTGLVCPWFDRSAHVQDITFDPAWTIYRVIDFGFSQPTCVIWIGVDYDNNWHIYDGIYQVGLTTPQLKEAIIRKDAGRFITNCWADSAQASDIQQLNDLGLSVLPVEKISGDSKESWDEYRARLLMEHGKFATGTKPRIIINSSLMRYDEKFGREVNWAVAELEKLKWAEKIVEEQVTQKPRWGDQPKHFIDVLSYFAHEHRREFDESDSRPKLKPGERPVSYQPVGSMFDEKHDPYDQG